MKSLCLIAIAGLVSVSQGEDFSLDIGGATDFAEGNTFTISVSGDSTFGTHMLGGGFGLVTDSGFITDISWTPASWSAFNEDGGYLGNGNYGDVVFGQLLLPIPGFDQPAAGSELGSMIGSFQVTVLEDWQGVIDFQLVAGSPFTFEAVDTGNGLQTMQDIEGTLSLGRLSITRLPSPAGLGVFGLAGLVATRRRR